MQRNIVKKMLMVMALSTSMAFGADAQKSSYNRFDILGNSGSSTNVKASKKVKRHKKQVKTIQGPTASISDLVPANTQNPSPLISAQPQELPPHLDELFGENHVANNPTVPSIDAGKLPVSSSLDSLSGLPSANTQDTSALASNPVVNSTEQVSSVAPEPSTSPLVNNSVVSTEVAPQPHELAPHLGGLFGSEPVAKNPEVPSNESGKLPVSSTSSLDSLSGLPSANTQDTSALASNPVVNNSEVSTEVAPQPSGENNLLIPLTVPASNNLVPSEHHAMPELDLGSVKQQDLAVPISSGGDVHRELSNDSFDQGSGVFSRNNSEASTEVVPQPQSQQVSSGSGSIADQLSQHQEMVAANTAAQLDEHKDAIAANTAVQLEQHQDAVEEKLAQHQQAVADNTADQLEQHQGAMAEQLAQHQDTLLSAIKNSAENSQSMTQVENSQSTSQVMEMPQHPQSQESMMTQGENDQPTSQVMEAPQHLQSQEQMMTQGENGSTPQVMEASQHPQSQEPMMTQGENGSTSQVMEAPQAQQYQQPMMTQGENGSTSQVTEVPQPPVEPVAKLPAEIMQAIEDIANKVLKLKGIVGGEADKNMLQAEVATVKAANDLHAAQSEKAMADKIDALSKRSTELLKMSEGECVQELAQISKELAEIESELYPESKKMIDGSTLENLGNDQITENNNGTMSMESSPFADGDSSDVLSR